MANDDESTEEAWLGLFESKVNVSGPEVAFRVVAQVAGHDVALRVKHAWERKVRLIQSLSGPATIRRSGIGDWYAGPSPDDRCWPTLRRYLLDTKGWPVEAVETVDSESTAVMKLLPHVGGAVDARGLVVGYVQSGKTANYTALIAKAADVGYRLVIVLAGVHNALRRQTQKRLKSELIDLDPKLMSLWHTLTQPSEDFRASGTNPDAFLMSHQRVLAVVKKNYFVLDRLVKWLSRAQEESREACPALIIDDEADQAGLNTSKDDRTAINDRILALKNILPRSAYVGYTATPFANVLVDPRGGDLYPSDFITALGRPKGYFGTELFFGRDALEEEGDEVAAPPDMFRAVPLNEIPLLRPANRAELASFAAGMPESLATAIRYFLLATCARWVRGHRRKHSSMMVHTALNTSVHRSLHDRIAKDVNALRSSISRQDVRNACEAIWKSEHPRVRVEGRDPIEFDELWTKMPEVLARTKVVEDNGQSDDRLLYKEEEELGDDDPVAHIAVGGNTLSRGLTLEGLVVSYFVRSASTYDTLLQMGRWFGYRVGYEDLPRLWMTDELRDAFHDLATIEEEVRRDIARYATEGLTPLDFAVRIRTHPTMAVTSRLKMQFAVPATIDYTGFTRQTRFFEDDRDWLVGNWNAAASLYDRLATKRAVTERDARRFFTDVHESEVRAFLKAYRFHVDHNELRSDLLIRYMDAQLAKGRCGSWTVALVAPKNTSKGGSAPFGGSGLAVNLATRSLKNRPYSPLKVDLGTLTTQADFGVDLPPGTIRNSDEKSRDQPTRPIDSSPLLLLYPISRNVPATTSPDAPGKTLAYDVLGVALAFPDAKGKATGDYIQVDLPKREVYIDEEEVRPAEDDG